MSTEALRISDPFYQDALITINFIIGPIHPPPNILSLEEPDIEPKLSTRIHKKGLGLLEKREAVAFLVLLRYTQERIKQYLASQDKQIDDAEVIEGLSRFAEHICLATGIRRQIFMGRQTYRTILEDAIREDGYTIGENTTNLIVKDIHDTAQADPEKSAQSIVSGAQLAKEIYSEYYERAGQQL